MFVLCCRSLRSMKRLSVCVCLYAIFLIACDLGLFIASFCRISVETDSVEKRPVALLLKFL